MTLSKAISLVLIGGLVLSDPALAVTTAAGRDKLCPVLATKPSCSADVATGESLTKEFRDTWAVLEVGRLVARALELQISKHTLIPLLNEQVKKRDGLGETLLQGFDFDGIEEIHDGGKIKEFSLPVKKNGKLAYELIFYMTEDETEDIPVLTGGRANVYLTWKNISAAERMISNRLIENIYRRRGTYEKDRKLVTDFAKPDHMLKVKIFSMIDEILDGKPDAEALKIIDGCLAMEPAKDNGFVGFGKIMFCELLKRPLALRELFLRATAGEKTDVTQAITHKMMHISSLNDINRHIEKGRRAEVEGAIKSMYLLLKGLEILSGKQDLVLVQAEDVDNLSRYLARSEFVPDAAKNMLDLADLFMPVDTPQKQKSLANLARVINKLQQNENPGWQDAIAAASALKEAERVRRIYHDLSNALSVVYGFAQMVAMTRKADQDTVEFCGRLQKTCRRLIDSANALRENVDSGKRDETIQNLRSFKEVFGELIDRMLTPDRITSLTDAYVNMLSQRPGLQEKDLLEKKRMFECMCKGLTMILLSEQGFYIPEKQAIDVKDLYLEKKQPININETLDIASTIEAGKHSSVELIRNFDSTDPRVPGFEGLMFRLLVNLSRNACEEAKKHERPKVTVRTQVDGDNVKIEITNTGCMPQDKVDAFNEGRTVKTSKGEGHGRGLEIVWKLVKANGGKIEVRSEPGKGTTFAIVLPINTPLSTSSPIVKSNVCRHRYVESGFEEKESLLFEINNDIYTNRIAYFDRFMKGIHSNPNSAKLDIKDFSTFEFQVRHQELSLNEIFHENLLRDEDGILWIVKRHEEDNDGHRIRFRGMKNFPEREKLAYLLSRNIANCVEIRSLTREEAENLEDLKKDTSGIKDLKDYYLVRIATSANMKNDDLPTKTPAEAYSSIFVANIFMRKWDPHIGNIGYAWKLPVMLDNDETLRKDLMPNTRDGFNHFMARFFRHTLFDKPYYFLYRASEKNENCWQDLAKICTTLEVAEKGIVYETKLADMKRVMKEIGLNDGFMAAEMLNEEHIRRSILEFKNIENVRELAIEAGYKGEELDSVVEYVTRNQETLGRDVNAVLEFITGKDHGLDEIDKEKEYRCAAKDIQEPTLETEEIHAELFKDTIKYIEANCGGRPDILALGTSWIKGYGKKGRPSDDINLLIIAIRRYCESRGIHFTVTDDENLLSVIESARKGRKNAKVAVLASRATVTSNDFKDLRDDKDVFLAGVNGEKLKETSYMRLVEMLTLTLRLAYRSDLELPIGGHPHINIARDKDNNCYIFEIKDAEAMDVDKVLHKLYSVLRFA